MVMARVVVACGSDGDYGDSEVVVAWWWWCVVVRMVMAGSKHGVPDGGSATSRGGGALEGEGGRMEGGACAHVKNRICMQAHTHTHPEHTHTLHIREGDKGRNSSLAFRRD